MTERTRSVVGWLIAAAAVVIIVAGLSGGSDATADPVRGIASKLKCPACQSESLADSATETARDLRGYIAEEVAAGRTEAEIIDYFVASYGESILLDPAVSGRGIVLWLIPAGVLGAGLLAILALRRPRRTVVQEGPS